MVVLCQAALFVWLGITGSPLPATFNDFVVVSRERPSDIIRKSRKQRGIQEEEATWIPFPVVTFTEVTKETIKYIISNVNV